MRSCVELGRNMFWLVSHSRKSHLFCGSLLFCLPQLYSSLNPDWCFLSSTVFPCTSILSVWAEASGIYPWCSQLFGLSVWVVGALGFYHCDKLHEVKDLGRWRFILAQHFRGLGSWLDNCIFLLGQTSWNILVTGYLEQASYLMVERNREKERG